MNIPFYPLRYLSLRGENGFPIWWRDIFLILLFLLGISIPFIIKNNANFFHKDGFIDKVGTFSSVLTGFYVAGLVAVATFAHQVNGLDKTIEVGRIKYPHKKGEDAEFLSRRQFVCSMFGYLAFLSLIITLASIVIVIVADANPKVEDASFSFSDWRVDIDKNYMRGVSIILFNIPVASLTITTLHGLYYLIDRLYAVSPSLLPLKDEERDDRAEF
ncbi:hypothetical protein BRX37_05975 [Sphingomonas sp. S-NIH.Pt3_0716]|nr:hypothetical protein BRX37_05975 [Sphingomonas sp. S-NIH.Pt3_0716]